MAKFQEHLDRLCQYISANSWLLSVIALLCFALILTARSHGNSEMCPPPVIPHEPWTWI